MTVIIFFLSQFFVISLSRLFSKLFQIDFKSDAIHYIGYNAINAAVATVNFLLILKGKIVLNKTVFCFSLIYAFVIIITLCLSVAALKYMTVALNSVISSIGSLTISTLFGMLFLKEPFTPQICASLILLLIAVILPFCFQNNKMNKDRTKAVKALFLISAAVFTISGASNVLLKAYTLLPTEYNSSQLFFWCNLNILCICLLCIPAFKIKPGSVYRFKKMFTFKQLLLIIGLTLTSNVNSLLGAELLKRISISGYTVVSSSITIVSSLLVSSLFFKEKVGKSQTASALAVILATALCTLK